MAAMPMLQLSMNLVVSIIFLISPMYLKYMITKGEGCLLSVPGEGEAVAITVQQSSLNLVLYSL